VYGDAFKANCCLTVGLYKEQDHKDIARGLFPLLKCQHRDIAYTGTVIFSKWFKMKNASQVCCLSARLRGLLSLKTFELSILFCKGINKFRLRKFFFDFNNQFLRFPNFQGTPSRLFVVYTRLSALLNVW
jgi:hypothetical protein